MKPEFAIVESDLARHGAAVDQALSRVREAEQHAEQADRRAQSAHEAVRARRLELGRALIAARRCFPKASRNAKGWTDFLAVRRMTLEQAQDAMKYAGFVDETLAGASPDDPANLPTMREAGLDPRPRGGERPQLSLVPDPEPEVEIDRDSWCTPPEITIALPAVDLDPCSNERSTVRAAAQCWLSRGEDGLKVPWRGSIWINGPFSSLKPWAVKLDAEWPYITACGWLCNTDSTTEWWRLVIQHLPLRLDLNNRTAFVPPPGVKASTNDRPQTLLMDDAFWSGCNQPALLKLGTLWRRSSF